MAYGMEQLRKAGKFLGDWDERYAIAADRQNIPIALQGGHALPLRDAIGFTQDPNVVLGGKPDTTIRGRVTRGVMDAGYLGANVASRYMLPAGGVTLAGVALVDLTAQFGGGADKPQPQELTLNA